MTAQLFDEGPAFESSPAAARARLAAVRASEYARSRNAIEGAVTRLSPYITHGFLSLAEVLTGVAGCQRLDAQHKFVFELGWRDYFQHVWAHEGDRIFASLHAGPLPDSAYIRELPVDVREARTGVPVVDEAVRALYRTGYLHNHARMWLASYVVHLRRVHWRAGADWMYAHLLDGDLASNHLSWQWVAGTGSHKPYLFNAENVARYAPEAWHSPGTVVDRSYEALDAIARGAELSVSSKAPPFSKAASVAAVEEPSLHSAPPAQWGFKPVDEETLALVRGRHVHVVHPWALADFTGDLPTDSLAVAVLPSEFTRAWPWAQQRWAFVGPRLQALAALHWWAPQAQIVRALRQARSVSGTANPHLPAALNVLLPAPTPRLTQWPARRSRSFSQFWHAAQLPPELLAASPTAA